MQTGLSLFHSLKPFGDVLALGPGARTNAKSSDNRVTCKVRQKDMISVCYDSMRYAGFSTFSCCTLELPKVFALYGNFRSTDGIVSSVGHCRIGIFFQTVEQRICVSVPCLGRQLSWRHFEIVSDKGVDIEFFFDFCLWQCGLTVLVNAKYVSRFVSFFDYAYVVYSVLISIARVHFYLLFPLITMLCCFFKGFQALSPAYVVSQHFCKRI